MPFYCILKSSCNALPKNTIRWDLNWSFPFKMKSFTATVWFWSSFILKRCFKHKLINRFEKKADKNAYEKIHKDHRKNWRAKVATFLLPQNKTYFYLKSVHFSQLCYKFGFLLFFVIFLDKRRINLDSYIFSIKINKLYFSAIDMNVINNKSNLRQ